MRVSENLSYLNHFLNSGGEFSFEDEEIAIFQTISKRKDKEWKIDFNFNFYFLSNLN